jgi:hypothetical protein
MLFLINDKDWIRITCSETSQLLRSPWLIKNEEINGIFTVEFKSGTMVEL